ncbi:MAG: DUF6440 family protein [Prolixibacteraceae bacterium]|nr:DUF6440 family protein [Prolixibacteraceae bacterium]
MENEEKKRFLTSKAVGTLRSIRVITDTKTGVQYLFVNNGYAGGLTLLVDKDGKPLIDKSKRYEK